MSNEGGARCGYGLAWIGPCKADVPCAKHSDLRCASCGAPATHECDETGMFVCGVPLCNDCEHTIFPDGTNGGIGFNAQSLPGGVKRHVRKDEQVNLPWYWYLRGLG